MSEIIKLKLNEGGRAIATLYGTEFDVTELADENGKGEFKAFSKNYQFEIKQEKTAKKVSKKYSTKKKEKTLDFEEI